MFESLNKSWLVAWFSLSLLTIYLLFQLGDKTKSISTLCARACVSGWGKPMTEFDHRSPLAQTTEREDTGSFSCLSAGPFRVKEMSGERPFWHYKPVRACVFNRRVCGGAHVRPNGWIAPMWTFSMTCLTFFYILTASFLFFLWDGCIFMPIFVWCFTVDQALHSCDYLCPFFFFTLIKYWSTFHLLA